MKQLKEYDRICNELVEIFTKKHNLEFDYWVSNEVGGIASFSQYYLFCFEEIVFDLKNNAPQGLIVQWYNETVKYITESGNNTKINFGAYKMGFRYEHLTNNNNETN